MEEENRPGRRQSARAPWVSDVLRGFVYAALILLSILFFSGAASRFIYVDF